MTPSSFFQWSNGTAAPKSIPPTGGATGSYWGATGATGRRRRRDAGARGGWRATGSIEDLSALPSPADPAVTGVPDRSGSAPAAPPCVARKMGQ